MKPGRPRKPQSRLIGELVKTARKRRHPVMFWVDGHRIRCASLFRTRANRLLKTRPECVIGTFDHNATADDLRHALSEFPWVML